MTCILAYMSIYDTYMNIYVKEYRKLTQNIYVRIYVRTVFHICFIWATCMFSIYEPSCLIYVRYVNSIELHICILYEYMWWHICHISTYKLNIWNVSLLVYFFIWPYMSVYGHIWTYMDVYVEPYKKHTLNIYVCIYVRTYMLLCIIYGHICILHICFIYVCSVWVGSNRTLVAANCHWHFNRLQ